MIMMNATRTHRLETATEWDRCVLNKLHSVRPLLGYSNLNSLSRQDAVVLRRLCIGHTCLTHSYLLNRQDQPEFYCIHFVVMLAVFLFSKNNVPNDITSKQNPTLS